MFNDKLNDPRKTPNIVTVKQLSRYDGMHMQPGWDRQQIGTDLGKKISWEAASWNAGTTKVQIMEQIRTVRTDGFETLGSTGR
jgi:hypothetical protein